jgi:effector-binding domain-containing protein
VKNLVSIGRFSLLCRLTVKALRHYDELGLLKPATVDPQTGYRYYSVAQVVEANRIRQLREIEMPLDEIRAILRGNNTDEWRPRLEIHRKRMEDRIGRTESVLSAINRLLQQVGSSVKQELVEKKLDPQLIVSCRTYTSLSRIGDAIGQAFTRIYSHIGKNPVRPAGPCFTLYHDEEFDPENIDIEIGVPVSEPIAEAEEIVLSELPGGRFLCAVHSGPYDTLNDFYRELGAHIAEHEIETVGPSREVYIVGCDKVKDSADYRTEIQLQVS